VDVFTRLIVEFPKCDIVFGPEGFRWFMNLVLIQNTASVMSAHMGDSGYSSDFALVIFQLSFLRVVRLLMIFFHLAGRRLQKKVGELHIMVRALFGAFQPLLWCSLLIFITVFVLGMFFSQGAVTAIVRGEAIEDVDAMMRDWGTLWRSAFSLYNAILGGREWSSLYGTLAPDHILAKTVFVSFNCFTVIAMLNIVTAVFIKCAFLRFESDREFIVQTELRSKRDFLKTMRRIFAEVDQDGSGKIVFEEMCDRLKDPDVAAYFSKLGVDVDEVEKLFVLLDEDGSGTIDRQEFMFGCLRLKGEAKSLDLEILRQEVGHITRFIQDMEGRLTSQVKQIDATYANATEIQNELYRDVGIHLERLRSMDESRNHGFDCLGASALDSESITGTDSRFASSALPRQASSRLVQNSPPSFKRIAE